MASRSRRRRTVIRRAADVLARPRTWQRRWRVALVLTFPASSIALLGAIVALRLFDPIWKQLVALWKFMTAAPVAATSR